MTRLRGLAALLVTIAFAAGVPYLLVKFGSWPLSGVPSIGDARQVADTVVSDTMVFGVLTLAAWAVWAVFTLSLVVELVAAIRGSQAPRIAFAGALQRAARILVTAIILAVSLSHSHPAALAAAPQGLPRVPTRAPAAIVEVARPRQVLVATDPAIVGGPAVQAPEAGDPEQVVTVRRGDTAWGMAEEHLGDGLRWRELWELNRDRPQPDGSAWTNPQVIRPGWQLALPANAPPEQSVPTLGATAAPATYVVVDGDTLSGIAAAHLGDANRFPEIFEMNRDRVQPDGRHLTDPNLIVTGWQLVLPSVQVAGDPPVPTPAADIPPVEATPVEPPVADSTAPDPAPTATVTPASSVPPSSITPADQETQEAPEASPTSVTTTTEASRVVAGSVDVDDGSWWAAAVPVLAGVSGATVLATGLVLRLRRAQQRRLLRGTAETPTPTVVEHAIVSAADVPLVRWAGQALASMVARLDVSKAGTSAPVAVELTTDSGIEVLWEAPIPIAPAPWIAADEGWAWRLPYDPDAAVPVDSLPAAMPALTTIGRREGRQLLVDLEAFGTIAVAGDAQRVEDFLRAVALELSIGDDLADSYVLSVGVEDVATAERLMQVDAKTAAARAEATCASVRATLDSAGAPSTFAYRAGPDGVHLEATVVIVAASSDDSAAVTSVEARSGVAVIAAHERPDASARIEIASDGSARLEPLGVSFVAAGVPSESGTLIAELASEDMDDVGHTRATGHGDPSTNGHGNTSADVHAARINGHSVNALLAEPIVTPCLEGEALHLFELPDIEADEEDADAELPGRSPLDAQLVVKVLGTPRVPDRPKLARRELILTVFLACRGGRVNASAVVDALWGGRAVEGKTVSNLVGKTRTALGLLPDGTEVMLPADRRLRMKGLSPAVTTDLAMLRHLHEQAQNVSSSEAIGLLRQGLLLVEGQPFDADGYDWAHHVTQDVSEANRLIEQAAEQLVGLALDRNDVETAREAVAQGLRGLPGDEVLYRLRMRVEHHAGNLTGVSAAFEELTHHLVDFDAEPSPSTLELRRELLGGTRAG